MFKTFKFFYTVMFDPVYRGMYICEPVCIRKGYCIQDSIELRPHPIFANFFTVSYVLHNI